MNLFTFAEYVELSLTCNGNNLINVFAQFRRCLDPYIHDCRVRDLESLIYPTGGKAVAFELFNYADFNDDPQLELKTLEQKLLIIILPIYLLNGNDSGGWSWHGERNLLLIPSANTKPILIADNVIDTVAGNEGDAISVMSNNGLGGTSAIDYNANVFITGNHIKNFNRRGCKIKFNNRAVITNNTFIIPGLQSAGNSGR